MASEGLRPTPEPDERRAPDLLEGWKAIADHLGKTERTVQRWEKRKGLPARRLRGDSAEELPRVYALKSELDAWWNRQTELETGLEDEPTTDSVVPISGPAGTDPDRGEREAADRRQRFKRLVVLGVTFLLGALAAASLVYGFWPQISVKLWPPRAKIVLVVKPFKNLSGDSSQDYIAAGFTEEMVSWMGQLHPDEMAVIRLTPAYSSASPEHLGKSLRADYILEGSLRRFNDQIAITAQLTQVSSQAVVWGNDSYNGDVKDLLRIQSEVAGAIAGEVLKQLPHETLPARQVNRDAYDYYLRGRYFWNKRTAESLARAISLFQHSIEVDPTYAPPYAGLADCYELLGSAPYTALRPREAFPKAKEAARKALQLDDRLAEAHVSLGYSALVYEWNFAAAQKEFKRALELRPDSATAHQFYAYYLTVSGKLDEAIAERKKAVELEPLNPLLTSALGEAYYQTKQFDLAIEQNNKSLELDSSYAIAWVNIGRAYEQKGMHQQAREAFQKILASAPEDPAVLALMGHECAISGDKANAKKVITKLAEIAARKYVPGVYFALVYTGLNDKDDAFRWMEKAYEERCEYLVYLGSEPLADPLRDDPRFVTFAQRIGLSK
jgi:TolB-like protein/Flp pilus assembly protein TadD